MNLNMRKEMKKEKWKPEHAKSVSDRFDITLSLSLKYISKSVVVLFDAIHGSKHQQLNKKKISVPHQSVRLTHRSVSVLLLFCFSYSFCLICFCVCVWLWKLDGWCWTISFYCHIPQNFIYFVWCFSFSFRLPPHFAYYFPFYFALRCTWHG